MTVGKLNFDAFAFLVFGRACARQISANFARFGLTRRATAPTIATFSTIGRIRNIYNRFSIPIGIAKVLARTDKIINCEEILAVKKSRSAPNNLLEFDDVVDWSHQHDVAHIFRIDTGRKFLRCRENRGQQFFVVLETFQISFALVAIIAGNTLAIIYIRLLGMFVYQVAEDGRMGLRCAEYNRLFVRIDLFQKFLDTELIALTNLDVPLIEIVFGVDFIRVNFAAFYIIIGVVNIRVDVRL